MIEVEDDGTVIVASDDAAGAKAALDAVEALTASVQVGRIYEGRVTSVKDFGAFVEILPGKDGLCHISELSDEYVRSVGDVCGGRDDAGQGDRRRRAGPREAEPQAGDARAGPKPRRRAGGPGWQWQWSGRPPSARVRGAKPLVSKRE